VGGLETKEGGGRGACENGSLKGKREICELAGGGVKGAERVGIRGLKRLGGTGRAHG